MCQPIDVRGQQSTDPSIRRAALLQEVMRRPIEPSLGDNPFRPTAECRFTKIEKVRDEAGRFWLRLEWEIFGRTFRKDVPLPGITR